MLAEIKEQYLQEASVSTPLKKKKKQEDGVAEEEKIFEQLEPHSALKRSPGDIYHNSPAQSRDFEKQITQQALEINQLRKMLRERNLQKINQSPPSSQTDHTEELERLKMEVAGFEERLAGIQRAAADERIEVEKKRL